LAEQEAPFPALHELLRGDLTVPDVYMVLRKRYGDDVVFDGKFPSYGAFLKAAIDANVSLQGCASCTYVLVYGATLPYICLTGSDLRAWNFRGCDLSHADFMWATLKSATFEGCDLRFARFDGADLRDVVFKYCKLNPLFAARLSVVPEGDLIGWKKCCDGVVVKLRIPREAKRSNATGRKCRAEYVEVLEISSGRTVAYGQWDATPYRVGETVRCARPFNENRWDECASGIHFFLTEEEAKDYPSRSLL
jgi:hypothetical protein